MAADDRLGTREMDGVDEGAAELDDGDMDEVLDTELADEVFISEGFSGIGLCLLAFGDGAFAPPFFRWIRPS